MSPRVPLKIIKEEDIGKNLPNVFYSYYLSVEISIYKISLRNFISIYLPIYFFQCKNIIYSLIMKKIVKLCNFYVDEDEAQTMKSSDAFNDLMMSDDDNDNNDMGNFYFIINIIII